MITQRAVKTHSSGIRAVLLACVVLLFALIAAPVAQGCYANDPNLVTVSFSSPPVSHYIQMIGTAFSPYFTITSAVSDKPWAYASSILPNFGVVWTIDPAGLPLGLSCANLTTPETEIVPTACDNGVNPYVLPRGCPYGVYNPATAESGTCSAPAVGAPTTGIGSTTCISYYPGPGQLNVNVVSGFDVQLLDPVPQTSKNPGLLNGSNVMNAAQLQSSLSNGRPVLGVVADGVTQLVIRIDTPAPGEQFVITLLNDQSAQSISPNEDGALDFPGGTSFSQSLLTLTAGSLDSNGMAHAFAVYRAPIDFARPTGTTFKVGGCAISPPPDTTDDLEPCRTVKLQIQDPHNNVFYLPATVPVVILRPPVILVHGLWADSSTWDNFYPLANDLRFYVGRIDYSAKLRLRTSDPLFPSGVFWFAPRENALGYEHNAPLMLRQIAGFLGDFKKGHNYMHSPVAAVQADIVAHSFGGVITRTLPLLSGFLANPTFGVGPIHKLITVDTPHLGSPLAAKLLDITNNTCTRNWLARLGLYSFNTVTYQDGGTDNGAVLELQGNGIAVDNSLSVLLNRIAQPGPLAIPAALVAGSYTNWNSLDCTLNCTPDRLKRACTTDPLAQSFTHAGWPNNFGTTNNANDGLVSVTSQLNGLSTSNLLFGGLAHGPGIVGSYTGLGFAGTSALDASPGNPIATQVISLLNTPVNQTPFTPPINP